jgi:hypothetical protein
MNCGAVVRQREKPSKTFHLLSFVVVCCRLFVALVQGVARRETCKGATKLQGGAVAGRSIEAERLSIAPPKKPKNRGEVLESRPPPPF